MSLDEDRSSHAREMAIPGIDKCRALEDRAVGKATIDGGGHDLPSLRQAQLLSSNEPLTILHSTDPPEPREAGYVG